MIRIIEKHEPEIWELTCPRCKSIFQFEDEDCIITYDRSSAIRIIKCPVCGRQIDGTVPGWKRV